MYNPPEMRAAGPDYVPPAATPEQAWAQIRGELRGGPGADSLGSRVVRGFAESPAAIRAYHGSPHGFDRFDLSRLGSGEGAQAYGHGLYFAGNEAVAQSYKTAGPASVAQYAEINRRMADLSREMNKISTGYRQFRDPVQGARLAEEYDALMASKERLGHMYEVNLQTHPNRLLDWDAPLSQQPAPVREALSGKNAPGSYSIRPVEGGFVADYLSAGGPRTSRVFSSEEAAQRAGRATQEIMQDSLSDWTRAHERRGGGEYNVGPNHADTLRMAGIDGIQYLDGGSRATAGGELLGVERGPKGWQAKIRVEGRGGTMFAAPGQQITTSRPFASEAEAMTWAQGQIGGGSRNFVIFDDKLVDIIRRYGVLPPVVGGAAASGSGEQ